MGASFFADLVETSTVEFVYIWPRVSGGANLFHNSLYYEGMNLRAGSILCPNNQVYTQEYVMNTLVPNKEPMIFTCPQGTYENGYVHLAEMEVFIVPTSIYADISIQPK